MGAVSSCGRHVLPSLHTRLLTLKTAPKKGIIILILRMRKQTMKGQVIFWSSHIWNVPYLASKIPSVWLRKSGLFPLNLWFFKRLSVKLDSGARWCTAYGVARNPADTSVPLQAVHALDNHDLCSWNWQRLWLWRVRELKSAESKTPSLQNLWEHKYKFN